MSFEQPHSAANQPTPERRPHIADVITEPDVARLTGYRDQYGVDRGKFIRIGALVLLVPLIPDSVHNEDYRHLQMLEAGYHNPDTEMQRKVREAADNPVGDLLPKDPDECLEDSGYYFLSFSDKGMLVRLNVGGQSYDFGRAEEAGRQRTVDLIQEKLGPEIGVED